jgi:hypothetical protein
LKRIAIVIILTLAILPGCTATKSSVPQDRNTPNNFQIAEPAMPNAAATPVLNALYPISSSGKFGYLNANGNIVVQPKYDLGMDFNDGYALVMLNKKWGFIDSTGKEVIPLQFINQPTDFKNGLARLLSNNGKLTYINTSGKIIWQAK